MRSFVVSGLSAAAMVLFAQLASADALPAAGSRSAASSMASVKQPAGLQGTSAFAAIGKHGATIFSYKPAGGVTAVTLSGASVSSMRPQDLKANGY